MKLKSKALIILKLIVDKGIYYDKMGRATISQ